MRIHMKSQSFLKGAAIVALGGIAAKILGAFYRIPMTNLLGGEGMGMYQMVYPLYCLLLTVSATGIPSGLARMVAAAEAGGDFRRSRAILRTSLAVFSAIGFAGSAAMVLLAPLMGMAQREPGTVWGYRALAPGVFFVSVLSCFRGWFQGKSNFVPTALSEICEQAVKVALGLWLVNVYKSDVRLAVTAALFAVTASESAACLLMGLFAKNTQHVRPLFRDRLPRVRIRSLLRITVPVTVAAGLLPLSGIADSILIVRMIGRYADNATALYGLFAGGAVTLVNLPVSVCYGIAAAIIPAVSALQSAGKSRAAEAKVVFALKCTLYLACPAAVFLGVFPGSIASFLFRSVSGTQGETLAMLVRALAPTAVLLSAVQTLSACLTGRGKPKIAAISMAAAVGVKFVVEAVLLQFPQISVLGAAYACIACYFVALLVNLLYSIRERKNRFAVLLQAGKFLWMSAVSVSAAAWLDVPIVLAFGIAAAVYLALSVVLRAFSGEELHIAWRKKHDNRSRIGLQSRRFV